MDLSRTVSEIDGDFRRKSQNFPAPLNFAPPLKGFPLEFCTCAGCQKTKLMELLGRQRSLTISSAVWTQCTNHTLIIRILRILKFPKIHEFLWILKLSVLKFIKFKLSHSSPTNSKKLFAASIALNLWKKIMWCQQMKIQLPTVPFNSCLSVIDCIELFWSVACFVRIRRLSNY